MIKTSLLHPSFGRPEVALKAYREWESMAEGPDQIEYVLGLDDNDPDLDKYLATFKGMETRFAKIEISIGDSRSVVQVLNRVVNILSPSSELFVTMADDMGTIHRWDSKLYALIEREIDKPKYLYVTDGMTPYGNYSNYLIINRAFYNRIGYMLWHEYDGFWADVDVFRVAKILGAVVEAPHLFFQHRHFCVGLSPMDSTYARHNNPEGAERNRKVYEARLARNFDI